VLRFFRVSLYRRFPLPVKVKFGTKKPCGRFINIIQDKEYIFFRNVSKKIGPDKKEMIFFRFIQAAFLKKIIFNMCGYFLNRLPQGVILAAAMVLTSILHISSE